uniref:CSON000901 protein n=1 Tax=Culicoides sonorensis TaxID=179676 RepID=A0A336KAT2_CULSO
MNSTEKQNENERNISTTTNHNDEDDRTVFVGNLAEKVTNELLYELFLQAGPIDEISIPKDKESGKQKSFGFVRYKHAVSVGYACNIYKGTRLFGRELNIKSRNKDANTNLTFEPRGLQSLIQGFQPSNTISKNMLPNSPAFLPAPNSFSMIDPIFLQTLTKANPYGDIKFGDYNYDKKDQGKHSYKDRGSRHSRHDERKYKDDRYQRERKTDKWKQNRR